jgi:radical SAM family uncharacterized protein
MTTTSTPPKSKKTTINNTLLEQTLLPEVSKPGRYLGLEQGAYRKDFNKAKATLAFAFPDLYEIGISNYGIKLLYSIVNQHPDYLCDRVYAPAPDMKAKLAEYDMPLFGVETRRPLMAFDLLAFSLQYELNYTTILGAMEAAQLPLRAKDRPTLEYPILIAGGPGSGNPMSLEPFFDAFILGDGEEILIELLDVMAEARRDDWTKDEVLDTFAEIEGTYVPGRTQRGYKRIVDIAKTNVDIAPLVPAVGSVFDRVVVEARRGCDRMCRFCQPCFINLPTREQDVDAIKAKALDELQKTGYEECSLLSLSIADYSHFKPLVLEVTDALKEAGASLSLSSQRADRFSVDIAEAVSTVKKSTLTFAPEAGTTRMRDVINKNLTDAEILKAVTDAYTAGWNKVKLYYMIGLPTETHEDLDGIVDTVKRMKWACKNIKREKAVSHKTTLEVNVTISNFVPKPHTPFQWFPQDSMATLREKIAYLREQFRTIRGVKVNFTDPEISKLEAVISKAGPELADVLELAYKKGAYLDAWDDMSAFDKWFEALHELGINEEAYTRERVVNLDDALPWDAIDMGLDKQWLKDEYIKATSAASTTPCFETCSTCGVCNTYSTWPTFMEMSSKKMDDHKRRLKIQREQKPDPRKGNIHRGGAVERVRLTIEKRDNLRFISHLDWLRMQMRAMKRAKLPIAYSQGFHPKPKIHFTPAVPLFMESFGEIVELDMTEVTTDIAARLNEFLPNESRVVAETHRSIEGPKFAKTLAGVSYIAWYQPQGQQALNSSKTTSPPDGANVNKACQTVGSAGKLNESFIRQLDAMTESLISAEVPNAEEPKNLVICIDEDDPSKVLNVNPYLSAISASNNVQHPIDGSVAPAVTLTLTTPDRTARDVFSIRPSWVLAALGANPADFRISRHAIVESL